MNEWNLDRAVDAVVAYIETHYMDETTMDDLAKVARYAKFYFSREFCKRKGLPPIRYLAKVRREQAKKLLAETDIAVSDIAPMVGYESVGTFSGAFSNHELMPPSVYRKLAKRRQQ